MENNKQKSERTKPTDWFPEEPTDIKREDESLQFQKKHSQKHSSVNSTLKKIQQDTDSLNKDAEAVESVKYATAALDESLSNSGLNIFDPANNAPNTSSFRTYDGLSRSEQEKLLYDKEDPSSSYGKKSKKFRMIPTSIFGKAAALTVIGIGLAIGVGIYDGKKNHDKIYDTSNSITSVISSNIINENGKNNIVSNTLNLQKISNNDADVLNTKNYKTQDFNDILSYMDNLASRSVAQSAQNYHMIRYGMEKGAISQTAGLQLLSQSKNAYQNFLTEIQSDKDILVVFIKQVEKGQDVFYKNYDITSLADEALGRKSSSEGLVKTPYEKFLFWANKRSERIYQNNELQTLRSNILVALGTLGNEATTHSYVQMATGVKTNYQNVNNVNPISTNSQATKSSNYDSLSNKAQQMMNEFSKQSQTKIDNPNIKPKP